MYLQKSITLHQRSLVLLSLIALADQRITKEQLKLKIYDHSKNAFEMIRLVNDRAQIVFAIYRYNQIKNRLITWYYEVQRKMFEPVMEKMIESEETRLDTVIIAERFTRKYPANDFLSVHRSNRVFHS